MRRCGLEVESESFQARVRGKADWVRLSTAPAGGAVPLQQMRLPEANIRSEAAVGEDLAAL